MTEEITANGPQETKRVNIAGLTEGLRKKELDRITTKLARDGWSLKEYNDAGFSGSHVIFTRPFKPGTASKPKAWPALAAIAVVILVIAIASGGKDNPPAPDSQNQASDTDVMDKDLKAYKKLGKDDRAKLIGKFLTDNNMPADQQPNFYNYVSEALVQKSDSVMLQAVLSNAKTEYATTGGKWHRPHYNLDSFETQFSAWDGSHHTLERLIKKGMNDEDSYKHIETRYRLVLEGKGAPHVALVTSFSGKNGFGATIKKTATAKATLDGIIIEIGEY